MAKKSETSNDDVFARLRNQSAPEGFEKRSDDLDGFWDPDLTPVRCRPFAVKLMDGNIEPDKPSILIFATVTGPTGAQGAKVEGERGEPFVLPVGSLIGIWYKPGMKKIRDLCGADVFMKQTGEKATGKPNPMKLFEVTSDKLGIRIPVTEDIRDKSRPRKVDGKWIKLTAFDSQRPASEMPVKNGDGSNPQEDDIDQLPY
jgi:hypothetical protein